MHANLQELIFGANDPHILWASDVALPTILHIFFFIFFPTLLIQLRSINHIIFRATVVCVKDWALEVLGTLQGDEGRPDDGREYIGLNE